MRSFRYLKDYPAGQPLSADDLLEFHAARLILLLYICGADGHIDGLTKMAKLDFFVRYPAFFARACQFLRRPVPSYSEGVEAPMVRHHYGPWDHRYYHVLAVLEGARLVTVRKVGTAYRFSLTDAGIACAQRLAAKEAFISVREHMQRVNTVLSRRTGESLKKLIYDIFAREVAEKPLGEEIR